MPKKYRVCLTKNGKYKKTLYRCDSIEGVYLNFKRIKEENAKIIFPRQYVNYGKIMPIKYEVVVTKITEEGDKFRILRDEYGKIYEEPPFGDWTILASAPYAIEETFWVYGKNNKTDRVTIKEIVKILVVGAYRKNMVKQVIIAHNKLVVYNEDEFDMVICKNYDDALRLHHALAKAARKNKIKSLLFMGTAELASIGGVYQVIKKFTNWPITRIWRKSTKH